MTGTVIGIGRGRSLSFLMIVGGNLGSSLSGGVLGFGDGGGGPVGTDVVGPLVSEFSAERVLLIHFN